MAKIIWLLCLSLNTLTLALPWGLHGTESSFESPSKRQLEMTSLEQIKYNLKAKGANLEQRELFDRAIKKELSGFLGYRGDSLEFLIYQDIIRLLIEEKMHLAIRKEFHFLAIPFQQEASIDSLEALSGLFSKGARGSKIVLQNTFALNFTIYANSNSSGLNSLVQFSKNKSEHETNYRKQLKQWFESLGMDPHKVDELYTLAYEPIKNKSGILLQLFDDSIIPYNFSNQYAYASYPNGFLSENRKISEYFLSSSTSPFPQELRLLLQAKSTLNPHGPLRILRYSKLQPSQLKALENTLRSALRLIDSEESLCELYRSCLLDAWGS